MIFGSGPPSMSLVAPARARKRPPCFTMVSFTATTYGSSAGRLVISISTHVDSHQYLPGCAQHTVASISRRCPRERTPTGVTPSRGGRSPSLARRSNQWLSRPMLVQLPEQRSLHLAAQIVGVWNGQVSSRKYWRPVIRPSQGEKARQAPRPSRGADTSPGYSSTTGARLRRVL